VTEVVNPGAYRLKLPDDFASVCDVFNEAHLRRWFDPRADRELDVTNPSVKPHPVLNKVVQDLDRKTYGRVPKSGCFGHSGAIPICPSGFRVDTYSSPRTRSW
jgi:hypothetical protein